MENLRKLYVSDSRPVSPIPIVNSPIARTLVVLIIGIAAATLVNPDKLPLTDSMREALVAHQQRFAEVQGHLADGMTSAKFTIQCFFTDTCRVRAEEEPKLRETVGGSLVESTAADLPSSPELALCMTPDRQRQVAEIVNACEAFITSGQGSSRDNALALLHAGYAKQRNVKFEEAKSTWDEAIRIDPTFAEPYVAKADWVVNENDFAGALALYETAAKLDQRNVRAFTGIGRTQFALGNGDGSYEAFQRALAIDPGDMEANYYYGQALEQSGELDRAADAYGKAALSFGKSEPRGLVGIENPLRAAARVQHLAGNSEAALVTISRAFDGRQPDPTLLAQRADYYEALGRYSEAAADLKKAIPQLPDPIRSELKSRIAFALKNAGEPEKANDRFQDMLENGGKQAVLRVQVFLKNRGYNNVPISGNNDAPTQNALKDCLASTECNAAFSKAN